ncbi:hypothetical protein, partial [Flavobacterium agri]|uniref:hypothetical protein n=1 Tax=Flavobacterium agri TaxID=2743471 RepID=UPI001C378EC7
RKFSKEMFGEAFRCKRKRNNTLQMDSNVRPLISIAAFQRESSPPKSTKLISARKLSPLAAIEISGGWLQYFSYSGINTNFENFHSFELSSFIKQIGTA